jgi:hypothetical protein
LGEKRHVQDIGGKPEGKTPLGRPIRKWESITKMDFQDVECVGMEWIEVV